MRLLRVLTAAVLILGVSVPCGAEDSEINVCIKVRGNTGIEDRVRDMISGEFGSFESVKLVEESEKSHLYIDLSVVEQYPIKLYGLGICIAYHINGNFFSRPTSDAAQFGEDRMSEVCAHLAGEIDKAFLDPLRQPME
jgi:hypothetical protein